MVLLDKPAGPTSYDAVARVRRITGIRSAGHTGTLDPFASGLLVILLGRATRLARFVAQEPKTYLATMRLGIRTSTDDRTGQPMGEPATEALLREINQGRLEEAMARLRGRQLQEPPSFSAKKVGGERSYRKARRGEAVRLAPVEVNIESLDMLCRDGASVTFRTSVSSGTYVRAIARDLGESLGTGAHLTDLRRIGIGDLSVQDAVGLEAVTPEDVHPVLEVLGHLPAVRLERDEREAVGHGRPVQREDAAGTVILLDGDQVLAVARADEKGWLRPTVVLEGA